MFKQLTILALIGTLAPLGGDTLAEKLKARENQGSSKVTPEIKKTFAEGIAAVDKTGIVKKARQVGDKAPDFTLKDATGRAVTLSEKLKHGPVVMTWYRGGW